METEYNREICISPMKDNNDDTYVVTIEDEYYSNYYTHNKLLS
jgi:hypothetical protein